WTVIKSLHTSFRHREKNYSFKYTICNSFCSNGLNLQIKAFLKKKENF
ncbi:unnamed protein product, partial [Heterotrigona itama]